MPNKAPSNVIDLDILRPDQRFIKIRNKQIDISFIPCAITFDIDEIVSKMARLDMNKVKQGGDEARKAFDLSLELCAAFCKWKHPDLDAKWLRENTNVWQITKFADEVKRLLTEAYAGAESYGKK